MHFIYFIRQEITGPPYEEMDGKFYVDHNGSLRTWKGKNGSIRSGDFFFQSPILATQEIRLAHVGGQHQEIGSTNHCAHIRKKNSNIIFTYRLLNRVNAFISSIKSWMVPNGTRYRCLTVRVFVCIKIWAGGIFVFSNHVPLEQDTVVLT